MGFSPRIRYFLVDRHTLAFCSISLTYRVRTCTVLTPSTNCVGSSVQVLSMLGL